MFPQVETRMADQVRNSKCSSKCLGVVPGMYKVFRTVIGSRSIALYLCATSALYPQIRSSYFGFTEEQRYPMVSSVPLELVISSSGPKAYAYALRNNENESDKSRKNVR